MSKRYCHLCGKPMIRGVSSWRCIGCKAVIAMPKRKKVYIAGPLYADNPYDYEMNCRNAEQWILPIAKAGFAPLCMHTMTRHHLGTLTEEEWLEIAMIYLEDCDILFLAEGWAKSNGSMQERQKHWVEQGKPVFISDEFDEMVERYIHE